MQIGCNYYASHIQPAGIINKNLPVGIVMNRYIIDKNLFINNIQTVLKYSHNAKVYAVIKYNGYGIGIVESASVLKESGISSFAVAHICEAKTLRSTVLPDEEILMLRPIIHSEELEQLIKLNVILTLSSEYDAMLINRIAEKLGINVNVHLKIDTGMGRYGFLYNETNKIANILNSCPNIKVKGIYTHFSSPYGNTLKTKHQFNRFMSSIKALKQAGIKTGIRHCVSSGTLFKYNDMLLDAVRIGSALLGRMPYAEKYGLKKVGYCETEIEELKTVPKGWTVGYGAKYHSNKSITIALCNIGSRNGFGIEKKHGKICMQNKLLSALHNFASDCLKPCDLYADIYGYKANLLGMIEESTSVFDVTGQNCKCGDKVKVDINPLAVKNVQLTWVNNNHFIK